MSSIGKNIRKIRTIKGLSQSAFANLFNLTRASISAYEEGRAEPKMDATLEIAKYFNIPIETLLSHEITVNEFANFNLHSIIEQEIKFEKLSIPYISSSKWSSFLKNRNGEFPMVDFPKGFIQGSIAFEVNQNIQSSFPSGSILLCQHELGFSEMHTYLVIDNETASVRNGQEIEMNNSMVFYRILQTIQEINTVKPGQLEERVTKLEQDVKKLLKKK